MKFELFPTLVKEYSVQNYPFKEKLLNIIRSTPSYPHNSIKGGVSSHNAFNKNNFLKSNKFFDLEEYFVECANNYSKEIGILPGKFTNCWFNIMGKDDYTLRHCHPGSSIVGAYYPLLEEKTCNLIFHSPIYPLQSIWYKKINTNSSFSYSSQTVTLQIKQDHLYIFPGWLDHETEINKGKERIVISFNIVPWNN